MWSSPNLANCRKKSLQSSGPNSYAKPTRGLGVRKRDRGTLCVDLSSTSFWAGSECFRASQVRSTHFVPASVDRSFFSMLHGQRTGELFKLVNNLLISNVVLGSETAPGIFQVTSTCCLRRIKDVVVRTLIHPPTPPHPSVTSRASSKLLRHVLST